MIRAVLDECHLSVPAVELGFNFNGNSWFMLILGGRTKSLGHSQRLCLETEVTGTSTTTGSLAPLPFCFIHDMKPTARSRLAASPRPPARPGPARPWFWFLSVPGRCWCSLHVVDVCAPQRSFLLSGNLAWFSSKCSS